MAPPPSQKGKFRPKKPPKKITRPEAAIEQQPSNQDASSQPTPGVPVAAAAAAPATSASTASVSYSRESGPGRGGGGRGRGRGRGRAPLPQGRVFFTGGVAEEQKPRAVGSGAGGAGGRTSTGKSTGGGGGSGTKGHSQTAVSSNRNEMDTTEEEVVGELETGIGGNVDHTATDKKNAKPSKVTSKSNDMDYDDDIGPGTTGTRTTSAPSASLPLYYTYDSDSSDEGTGRQRDKPMFAPLELPFPSKKLPLGIESSGRAVGYHNDSDTGIDSELQSSPFVDVRNTNELAKEKDSWFLVQLPTRLPPLQKKRNSTDNNDSHQVFPDHNDSLPSNSTDPNGSGGNISDVVTQPISRQSFDNTLEGAAPGKIGKILVYKSGKTVLVMEGPDGKEVSLVQLFCYRTIAQACIYFDNIRHRYERLYDFLILRCSVL